MRDLVLVLLAAGVGIVLTLGGCWAREGWRRRPWVDVLDMVAPSPPVVIKPLRCVCAARLSFCACAIDGVRNPRGAGRGRCRRIERWNADGSGYAVTYGGHDHESGSGSDA